MFGLAPCFCVDVLTMTLFMMLRGGSRGRLIKKMHRDRTEKPGGEGRSGIGTKEGDTTEFGIQTVSKCISAILQNIWLHMLDSIHKPCFPV